jgi:hypothetical protein
MSPLEAISGSRTNEEKITNRMRGGNADRQASSNLLLVAGGAVKPTLNYFLQHLV